LGGVVPVFERRQAMVVGGFPHPVFALSSGFARQVDVGGPPGKGRAVLKARRGPRG